jgi:hypothetical protein
VDLYNWPWRDYRRHNDYSGEEQFLVGGVYIGRSILRGKEGEKMELKHDIGLKGRFKTGKCVLSVAEDLI